MKDILDFYTNASLLELGAEADRVRREKHPHNTVTYIVDRNMLKEQGEHALYIEGLSIRTETVAELRGRRPWVPDHSPARRDRPPA